MQSTLITHQIYITYFHVVKQKMPCEKIMWISQGEEAASVDIILHRLPTSTIYLSIIYPPTYLLTIYYLALNF